MVRSFITALVAALLLGSVWHCVGAVLSTLRRRKLPPRQREVLLYAQLALRQRAPRNKLTVLPLRLGR